MLNECDEGHEIRFFHRVSEKNLNAKVVDVLLVGWD